MATGEPEAVEREAEGDGREVLHISSRDEEPLFKAMPAFARLEQTESKWQDDLACIRYLHIESIWALHASV